MTGLLFPGKTILCGRLALLALLSLLILPAYVDGSGGNDPEPGVADIRGNFLAAVNQARSLTRKCGNARFGPAPPVSWSDNLAMAPYLHSRDMVRNNILSHTGSDGSSAGQRISRQGYPWRTYGENIAAGNQTVSSVIRGWLGSERHCRNLMNPAFTEIGAGYAIGTFGGNPAARYWTVDLADRLDPTGPTIDGSPGHRRHRHYCEIGRHGPHDPPVGESLGIRHERNLWFHLAAPRDLR